MSERMDVCECVCAYMNLVGYCQKRDLRLFIIAFYYAPTKKKQKNNTQTSGKNMPKKEAKAFKWQ